MGFVSGSFIFLFIFIYEFDDQYANASMGSALENWPILASVVLQISAAVGLWFIAPWLSLCCFRFAPPKCSNCLFLFENFRGNRCPECGLFLGEEFHAPIPSASDSDSRVITTDSTPE